MKNTPSDSDITYALTEWGCLCLTLLEHGIDVSESITGIEGKAIVSSFLHKLERNGYIAKKEKI